MPASILGSKKDLGQHEIAISLFAKIANTERFSAVVRSFLFVILLKQQQSTQFLIVGYLTRSPLKYHWEPWDDSVVLHIQMNTSCIHS